MPDDFSEANRIFLSQRMVRARTQHNEGIAATKLLLSSSSIADQFDRDGDVSSPVDANFCRYTLPAIELLEISESREFSEFAAAQLLCCSLWRQLDDIIDGDTVPAIGLLSVSRQILELQKLLSKELFSGNPEIETSFVRALECICNSSKIAEPRHIWKRASLHELPLVLCDHSQRAKEAFRVYLSYMGFIHDTLDVFDDVSSGIWTIPVSWLKEQRRMSTFSRATSAEYFEAQERISKELVSELHRLADPADYPEVWKNVNFAHSCAFDR